MIRLSISRNTPLVICNATMFQANKNGRCNLSDGFLKVMTLISRQVEYIAHTNL